MVVDDDAFRCGYALSALVPLGATIRGPIRTSFEACRLLDDEITPDAVIMADRLADGSAGALLSAVRRRVIPHLVLVEGEGFTMEDLATSPVLRWPFASFQVADWVQGLGHHG